VNQAEADFRAEGDLLGISRALQWRAFLVPRCGSFTDGLLWLREAEAKLTEAGDTWGVATTLNALGGWLAIGGDYAGA
jgi:hypothetical protein